MKILIAEDDPNTRLLLTGSLRKLGHEVVATDDGASACALLADTEFDIVITDFEMPILGGIALCRHIRAAESDVQPYILLLTHHSDGETILDAIVAGADDYLCKPFNPIELRIRLEIGKRRVTQQRMILERLAAHRKP
jgi:DNA-binding response OmpR family regulator